MTAKTTKPAATKKRRTYKPKEGTWGAMSRDERFAAVTKEVIELMEAEGAFWLKPWDAGNCGGYGGMFNPIGPYFNAASGREYRGFNVYAMMARCLSRGHNDVRFLTWNQVKKLGGRVKEGEAKEYAYLTYWRFFEKKVEKLDESGNPTGEFRINVIPLLGAHRVYNVEQTEGIDPSKLRDTPLRRRLRDRVFEKIEETTPADRLWAAAAFVNAVGANTMFGDPRACYSPLFDHVRMPEVDNFWNESAFMSVIFHELAHWSGHKTRLDRAQRNFFGSEDYAREELVAEMASAILCAEFGIEGALQHPEYLNNWLERIKDDPKALLVAANHAQKAVAFLVELAEKNGYNFVLPEEGDAVEEESEADAA